MCKCKCEMIVKKSYGFFINYQLKNIIQLIFHFRNFVSEI